ncbi:MAG: alpha/beta fold hydrolase, partial [Spirochaetaceae bacterium]
HTDHAREALASTTQHTIATPLDPTVLSSLTLPTLIVWGEHDRVLRPYYGATFQTRIAGSRLELIAESGHVPHVEQPEATARLINDFLE